MNERTVNDFPNVSIGNTLKLVLITSMSLAMKVTAFLVILSPMLIFI